MVRTSCSRTASSAAFLDTDPNALALQVCEDTDSLREVHRAYACIEKLIVPLELGDADELNPTRNELSALVRVVNEELSRRIESVDKAVQAMRAAMVPSVFAPSPSGA
ncbi:hypothetical protein [Variovorax sp. 770b2]|uniref:hypothetical protein n=1 Tax=Variovorax sp. 770b2 TaxID=1566271 RepID=UPI0008E838EE|nr:hypothetical protein [Variovorax sp. 770b2]SFP31986.1 hypothetical protein SAMN03159339_1680 [Variovorax sp. 770b2]